MAAAINTTADPDTKSAWNALTKFLLFMLFIYAFSFKKKISLQPVAAGRSDNLFKLISTTAAGSTATDNYGGGNDNNNADVVVKVLHFLSLFLFKTLSNIP